MSPGQQTLADGLIQGTLLSEGFINPSKELEKISRKPTENKSTRQLLTPGERKLHEKGK